MPRASKKKNRRNHNRADRGQRAVQGRGGVGFENLELPADGHSKSARGYVEQDRAVRRKTVCEERGLEPD